MRDADAKARFIREAQAAAALNHPNICTIYEVGEHDGQSFIAMELVEGQSLKERIERGPLPIDDAISLAIQTGEGLGEAHEKGIVHRDIKPGNIMLAARGQAKILDFGLARLGTHTKLTKADTTLGTVAYMSPEQALIYQIMNDAPEPITSLRTGVPIELERIVTKCLERDRDGDRQRAQAANNLRGKTEDVREADRQRGGL
jgi:serine/threonine protein kinase